ncbi:hypothetical protein JNUCC83_04875 [Vagococcus sp. JNUCC 83]
MDYLYVSGLWLIVSIICYTVFMKDWKKLTRIQQWAILINMGLGIFSVINYFF